MTNVGLSFADPFLDKVNVGEEPNPYAPFNPTADIGLGGLAPSAADMAMLGERLIPQSQFTLPKLRRPPSIAFSPSRNELFVQGTTFRADDATAALQSEGLLDGPGTGLPTGGDWQPIDISAYQQYLQSIRNPSLGRLAAKNFGRGVDALQALGGRALQLLGAEKLGGEIVAQQEEELARTAPFERIATDIKSGSDAVDWFVANFAQQGPNMVESVLTAGLGFLAGSATGGPLVGAGGALAGLMGKTAFKQAVIAAAKKKAAGETLNAAEHKLLREAAGIAGAVVATSANNAIIGAADIYNELREQGADVNDIDARLKALGGSIPYAALETLPEFLLATRIFGRALSPKALSGRAALLKRGAIGSAVGGITEGSTELGQEALLLGLSDQDFSAPENVDRLINSFAAGFGVGAPIGAVANLRSKKPENLLDPAKPVEPQSQQFQQPSQAPQSQQFPQAPQLPAPPVVPMGGPTFMVTPEGVAYQDQILQQYSNVPPGPQPGSQGVLDIFGGQISARELEARMQPQQLQQLQQPQQPQQVFNSQQLPLPFLPQSSQFQLPAMPAAPMGEPAFVVTPEKVTHQNQILQQYSNVPPGPQPGSQGVFNVFGGFTPTQELKARMQPQQLQQLQEPQQAQQTGPAKFPQLSLFTKIGKPTAAALKEVPNAVQEQSSTPVLARKLSRNRKTVREGVSSKQGAARKSEVTASETPEEKKLVRSKAQPTGQKKLAKGEAQQEELTRSKAQPTGQKKLAKGEAQQEELTRSKAQPTGQKKLAKGEAQQQEKPTKSLALKSKAKQLEVARKLWDEEFADLKTQPSWEKLTDTQKEAWRKLVVAGKPTIAATMEIAPPTKEQQQKVAAKEQQQKSENREPTPMEILEEEISVAKTAEDILTFKGAIQTVIYYAFFAGEDTNVKKLADRARNFINNTEFTDAQMTAMDEAVIEEANYAEQLEAIYKGGKRKGEPKPWFSYVVARGLLPAIHTRITNLPEEYKVKPEEKPIKTSAEKITKEPHVLLDELINDLISRVREISSLSQSIKVSGKTYSNVVEYAKNLYAKTDEVGRDFIVRGHKLREYFKDDGTPKMLKSAERYIITIKEYTPEEQRQLEEEYKAARAARAFAEEQTEIFNLIHEEANAMDWDDFNGRFHRVDGTEIKNPIPLGRVRLLVKSFLSKLRVKPNVYIYANVADLKKNNPDLYRRAAAARKEGDFDTTNAAGYSFGDNVIVFTNFIYTEQQLRFMLAHETIGHFGLRSVVPSSQLSKILTHIYDTDSNTRAAVDAMVANRNMHKLEAIEEYLADNAANLDTSLATRVWNSIKTFLNKLGIEFQDDEARYFISLARKHVRQGNNGRFFSASDIANNLKALNEKHNQAYTGDLGSRVFAAGALNRRFGGTGGLYGAMDAFAKKVFGTHYDVPHTVSRILEHVQTLDNKARRSYGLSQIYRLLEKQQHYARSLLSKYQRMTSVTHSVDLGVLKKGVTEAEKERAGELLARAALLRMEQTTDEYIKSFDPLVFVDDMGNVVVDAQVRAEIERAGFVTAEEFRKGFDITYTDGSKVHFQYDVDENSPEWKVYLEIRETVNEAAIDLMLSNYEAAQAETSRVLNDLNIGRKSFNIFTVDDLAAIRNVAKIYQDKRYAGSDVANAGVEIKRKAAEDSEAFLIAFGRALFNDDVYAVWMKDPNAKQAIIEDLREFLNSEYDDIRTQLPSIRAKIKDEQDSFRVQKAVRDLFLFDLQSKNADYYAKRTILSSYVPFTRRGTEQVKLIAIDERGNPVALDEGIKATLPYFQFNSRSEAIAAAEELDKIFGGDNKFVLMDEFNNEVTVKLKAEVSRARQSPDLTEAVNFNEFIYVLNRLNINIAPDARERIITTLTNQNARARHNLQRSGTEGWDKDVVRSVSEFLETTAHVAAKKLFRHRLDDILLNNNNWLGDDRKLEALKHAVDNAPTDGARAQAQREYDEYAYMYRYMKGAAGDNYVIIDGKKMPTLGRGEDYREEAKQVLRWYSETTNITDSTEDLLSGETSSMLKLATVLMQLGGSVATAVVNLASLVTHSIPYLSYYNPARGFGGGYGEAKTVAALWRAARDVSNYRFADDKFLSELLHEGNYAQYGLTEDEAQFLLEQTEQGTLQAAQFNALIGTARGKVFNNKAQAAIQAWMSLFAYTEQFNRRVTALAAYRMEKDRLQAWGVTNKEELIYSATEAARRAVYSSQGEYAMFNRPEMARGNVLQYVFMYKQFVIITVQLLRSLPIKGQLLMLGLLLLASGVKGLPFADDIFDVVDTIAQKLGLPMASVEKELATWIDAVAPGMTPYAMRGVLDRVTGATVSTRLGMGDLIPLSGAFKASADPAREIMNFVGPVFSGISGLVGMAGNLAKYGAEVVGLRDDTTTISEIFQNSPIAALRAITDGMVYLNSGMIINNRGQVVSKEAPYHVILARMLGFYPAIATEQNDIVRLSKDINSYARAIKAEYVSAYVRAKLANDHKRMQRILADVERWNEIAEGTGLEIRAFVRSANRAAVEASRTTVRRYLKAAPKNVRDETNKLLQIHGLDEGV